MKRLKPQNMGEMNYRVCWTCRGLFSFHKSTEKEIDKHIRECNEITTTSNTTSSLKHYVCNQHDFLAIKQLKDCLKTHLELILKTRKDLLVLGFAPGFIDSLLNLSSYRNEKDKSGEGKTKDLILHAPLESLNNQIKSKEVKGTVVFVSPNGVQEIDAQSGNQELLTEEEKNVLLNQCKHSQGSNGDELECKLCHRKTKSHRRMLKHLSCHGSNGEGFNCTTCSFSTILRSKWNRHQCRNVEKVKVTDLLCEDCGECFQSKTAFSHHVATHHVMADTDSSIKSASPKVFQCKECPYVGRDMTSLSDHQRKHTGEYMFCDQPGCSFKSPYKRSLQQHLQRKHATEKAQVCHVCGFQTKHVCSLRKHLKLHEEVKQYVCAHCPYASNHSSDVVIHTRRKHLKEKKYACSECAFRTGYPMTLKKHLARHEQMRNCGLEGNQVKRGRKIKQHTCTSCCEIFGTMAKLKKHAKQCYQPTLENVTSLITDPDICEVFDKEVIYFDNQLDEISAEVYGITSSILTGDEGKNSFTVIVEDPLDSSRLTQDEGSYGKTENEAVTCKRRNPMLAETSRTLAAERNSPLLEESLFNLMSDFPKPPSLNRCQSASTLMFASLSPHLVDRPLTPDFLSENPASSFFQSLSRNMEPDNLTVASLT